MKTLSDFKFKLGDIVRHIRNEDQWVEPNYVGKVGVVVRVLQPYTYIKAHYVIFEDQFESCLYDETLELANKTVEGDDDEDTI